MPSTAISVVSDCWARHYLPVTISFPGKAHYLAVYPNAPAGTGDLDVLFLPVKFFDSSPFLLIQNGNPRVAFLKAVFAASLIFAQHCLQPHFVLLLNVLNLL